MNEPIPVMVRRFRCPHCPRSLSSKSRMAEHIGRCWRNPAARGCLTCRHFAPAEPSDPGIGYRGSLESCGRGVDLSGRRRCDGCGGDGQIPTDPDADLGLETCPTCGGNGTEVKPGPITNCGEWEPAELARPNQNNDSEEF